VVTSANVPGLLPVAIHGHAYLADPTYERETVQVIRQQADTSSEAGEQSLTPLGLWRRSQESWHHGAGQPFLDGRQGDEATDSHRFRESKGIDIWTRGQVSLLRPTLRSWSTTNTNLYLAIVAQIGTIFYLCASDGTEVYYNTIPFGGINTYAAQTGTGWTATNATIAASPAAGNLGWIRVTATASAAVTITSAAGTAGVPVNAGRSYAFLMGSKNISGSGAKTPQVNINWYTAAGALISSTTPAAGGGADSPSRTVGTTATAPATAAFASITFGWTANLTNGDIHDVGGNIGPADAVGGQVGPDIWTPMDINAGEAAQSVQSIASDGTYLWVALGTSGLHRWSAGGIAVANVPAAPASGQISLVGYANGFLLAAGSAGTSTSRQNSLWLVADPLGTPALSLIKTHPNTSFQWTVISPGRNCVYVAGNSGPTGEVYKVLFDPNTGSLSTAASPATYLPDGETVHALQFYAGGIIMGTGKGIRIGTADGAGNIDYGPLIETTWPVRCLEPQDRYCWFGLTKHDPESGLGRIDLGFLVDSLTPAWAPDLVATSTADQGDTVSCVTFTPYGYTTFARDPVRVFTVAGKGVYIEDPGTRMADGTFSTGTVRFSTSEPKTARSVDVRHHALPANGDVEVEIQADSSGTWTSLGTSSTTGSYGPATPFSAATAAEAFELRFTLSRPTNNGTDFTRSPEVTRWTLKALPLPSTIDETFTLTLHMKSTVDTTAADGQPYRMDVSAEIAFLKALERARTIVDFQVGSETFEGYVLGSKFMGEQWEGPLRRFAEGKLQIQMQTARG
jgi:hypothetical protein